MMSRVPPISREVLAARTGAAVRLQRGDILRVVNTHGTQVVDFWAVRPPKGDVHLSMSHTRGVLGRLRPKVGDDLYDSDRVALLTFIEDTSPGVHDTLIPACDQRRYEGLGAEPGHPNCRHNFEIALEAHGIHRATPPDPFNLFMNIPWGESGDLRFEPGVARPGDRVAFLARAQLIAVLSACPQDLIPINGAMSTPRDVGYEIERADSP